jgi:zinc/manganese transport system permease protein
MPASSGFEGPTWNIVQDLREILAYGIMQNAFAAGTLVAITAGIVGYFVVLRRLAFATEALGHGGFAGATGAVLIGQEVFLGLIAFASAAINLVTVGVMYRPLLFASLDPEIAAARGLPVRGIGITFMLLLGFAVATARPAGAMLCAVVIAVLCVWLGLLIGFYVPLPPSFFITTLAFGTYLATRPGYRASGGPRAVSSAGRG